jgi:hypothetical protein
MNKVQTWNNLFLFLLFVRGKKKKKNQTLKNDKVKK